MSGTVGEGVGVAPRRRLAGNVIGPRPSVSAAHSDRDAELKAALAGPGRVVELADGRWLAGGARRSRTVRS